MTRTAGVWRSSAAKFDASGPTLWDAQVESLLPSASGVGLCVLASSSSGNCSVIVHGEGRLRRATLVDAGLSPARTRLMLASMGLDLSCVDEVLLTHLDADHFHAGWVKGLPTTARLCVHRAHRGRAERSGAACRPLEVFEGELKLRCGARVRPVVMSHDSLGVVSFRIDWSDASLGYATDLGRITPGFVGAMSGVDVLAIESNYCPKLQHASDRPEFLKRRIMDGAGHLSNEECGRAVRSIGPRRHVVLLHLSRECNDPELAASHHLQAGYRLTVARADEPTPAVMLLD
ncbi:MAG: MBL fold metallo-hydrolase [Planctomycetota bacterium]|nr:MBL fold metallo-hydrolase [Planctomycetota bacterium]